MAVLYKISDARGFAELGFLFINTHNQAATVTVEGSFDADFEEPFTIGNTSLDNPFTLAAGSSASPTREYQVLGNPVPYIRIKVQFSTAPTSGELTVIVFKQRM